MKYYKNENNEVYGYEDDGSQDHLITNDMTAITEAEADAINNPPLTGEELIQEKWNTLTAYLFTLTVTTNATNKFDVSPRGLANITQRVNTMIDTDTDVWHEDWASFSVDKVELQEALVLQAKAKKAKITELFGAV